MKKLLIANWKTHPATESGAVALARATDLPGLVICPPHEFVREVGREIVRASLGAQDYAPDLSALGVRYAIIGHSDRRSAGDTFEIVAEKTALAAADGLIPIVCVGETADERREGVWGSVIREQVISALSRLPGDFSGEICIAYEPVWAISTTPGAETETPEDAEARIARVREAVLQRGHAGVVRFLYGGSVTAPNAPSFADREGIGGLLVGGASLKEEEIRKIWQQLQKQ